MLDDSLLTSFERIYATDLVYAPSCWQLCGNAHCCNFTRYRSRFTLLGHQFQELPLLPGEFEFLQLKGWTQQFGIFEHRVIEYQLFSGQMRVEFLVGRTKNCACDHDTRTTTCRLYPMLPVFNIDGAVVDVDVNFGIFEEVEAIDGLERACKIQQMPLAEVSKFLAIAAEIGRHPKAVFYVMAYRLVKQHAREQLQKTRAQRTENALNLLEGAFLLGRLLDQRILRPQIGVLAGQFRDKYGPRFALD